METTKTFWLPEQASTFADAVDWAFGLYFWISLFFFALIIGLITYFVLRYARKRPEQMASGQMIHNTMLELSWTIIPLLIVMGLFFIGMRGYWHMRVAPSDAVTIDVVGRKWSWSFDYTQGFSNDTLVVPVHQPVRLRVTSTDVLHSFFIPAFRAKADVIPGRYHSLWFEATRTGVFPVLCTQYCGTNHSFMLSAVKVLEREEYDEWLKGAAEAAGGGGMTPAEFGATVYTKRGCNACHSPDGKPGIGPTWQGLWGKSRPLTNGSSVLADEAYIRQSILEPPTQVVAGFQPIMPPYKGIISDREIEAVIAYIQTLK
ncbi:MAG: Cytochrome c oxidase polypeptide [Fibrobacteria bacterium]|jgi:cytochrome c oxidase subunit 2|nr:Cytochrome c oxidase polypeptide [Fibrobacteria bacterium]